MRVPLGWLSEFIPLPASQEDLVTRLTLGGLEIEDVEQTGPDLSALLIGQVLTREPHPNADRLSVCRVDLGGDESLEVVCGAPNVAAGQKVAVARSGTLLPDGTKLKKSKIRGVVSQGMICSERELGLGGEHEGILVLDADAPLGAPLSDVLGAGQAVLDVEITPNRGDWASLLGIAREVRAHFGGQLDPPAHEPPEAERPVSADVRVRVEDVDGCYRYVGRVVRGVQLGPSPVWLREKLEAAGSRSINNIVDVTNLVLLELGQPIHAFDLRTLGGGEVIVRSASPGEKLRTLDGQLRALEPGDLVIADTERAIALAGIMGGAETEVCDDTCDLLIESAQFDPSRIRRTARRLGLHTDSSYRFERGVDRDGIQRAADRAARLLAELAGGSVSAGVVDVQGKPPPPAEDILLDPGHPDRLLGTCLSTEELVALLSRVDIRAELTSSGALRCSVPSYRNDLRIAEDLIEEIARVYGYDRIETTLPLARLDPPQRPARLTLEDRARDALKAAGLTETMSFPGVRTADFDALQLPADDRRRHTVGILNPMTEQGQGSRLRTTLLPSLLSAVRRNLARQVERVRIFEMARVFVRAADGALPEEPPSVGAAITRGDRGGLWSHPDPAPLFFEAKGVVEGLFRELGHSVQFLSEDAEPFLHPGAAAQVVLGKRVLGAVGEIHPRVASELEIDCPCAVFELDLSPLLDLPRTAPGVQAVSRQPSVRRDVAVILPREQAAGAVLAAVRKTAGAHLVAAEIFDRYEGEGIPQGKVSLAFRTVFQRDDRALTDEECQRIMDRIRQMLVHRFNGELR